MNTIIILGFLLSIAAFAVPDNSWVMRQIWKNLSFTHYDVKPEELRKILPKQLELDTYNGRAFVGVVTLEMKKGNLHGVPVPLYSPFPQVNVRTYVKCNGKRGIYFFSIDADHVLGPLVAGAVFNLPYRSAHIRWEKGQEEFYVFSTAQGRNYEIAYRSGKKNVSKDDLVLWQTDITRSYQIDGKGRVFESTLWHEPFYVRDADASVYKNDAFSNLGLEQIAGPETHYVDYSEVFFYKDKQVSCQ